VNFDALVLILVLRQPHVVVRFKQKQPTNLPVVVATQSILGGTRELAGTDFGGL